MTSTSSLLLKSFRASVFPGIAALALMASASAQTAYTVPEGYVTVSIPAGSVGAPSVTTFSLSLRENAPSNFVGQASGKITGVTSNTITNSSAAWSAGALSQAATPYFIRIMSGAAKGRTLQITTTANTSTTITVNNQGTDLTTLGITTGTDTYEIFPGDTLNTFFGTSTLGSTAAASADVVRIHSGTVWNEYYFNTTANQWRLGSVPVNQNNVVLRPDSGITFYRRGTSALQYVVLGRVPSTDLRVVVNNSGITYVGGVFPVNQTLSTANFNSLSGWVNNTGSVTTADKVTIWSGSVFNSYNFNQAANQWRNGSVPVNQNNVVITAGTPVIIERPNVASGTTTLVKPIPYDVNN